MECLATAARIDEITTKHFTLTTVLTPALLYWLDSQQWINITSQHCPYTSNRTESCNTIMELIVDKGVSDGYLLQCPKHARKSLLSIRHDSWFYNRKLSIPTLVFIIDLLECGADNATIIKYTGISSITINSIIRNLQLLMCYIISNGYKPVFTNDDIVETDEMYLKWEYKVEIAQGTFMDDVNSKSGLWIIGLINRSRTKLWMMPIESQQCDIINNLIEEIIEPGTVLMADGLRAYEQLYKKYQLFVIKKSVQGFGRFSNRLTDTRYECNVNVNTIESTWSHLRKLIRKRNAQTSKLYVHLTIAEFIYRFHNLSYFDLIKLSIKD